MTALSVSIGADISDLRAKFAVAQSDFRDFNAQTKSLADQWRTASDEAKAGIIVQLEAMATKAAEAKAQSNSLASEIKELGSKASEGGEQAGSAFDRMKESAERFHGSLGTALAGGEFLIFKELGEEALHGLETLYDATVEKAIKFDLENAKIAAQLGVTTVEAASLSQALQAVGSSADEYAGMAMKLDKQIKSNEQGLNALGMVTRDQDGALLSQTDLMKNAIDTMGEYKAGADQNTVAMTMFGRGAREIYNVMRVTDESVAKFNETLQEMGVSTAPEATKNSAELEDSVALLRATFDDFGVALGQRIGPEFKGVIDFMRDVAGPALNGLRIVAEVAFAAIDTGVTGVVQTMELGSALIVEFGDGWQTLGKIMVDVGRGNLGQAAADWDTGLSKMKEDLQEKLLEMQNTGKAFQERMANLLEGPKGGGASLFKSGDKDAPDAEAEKKKEAAYNQSVRLMAAESEKYAAYSAERIAILQKELTLSSETWGKDAAQTIEIQGRINAAMREASTHDADWTKGMVNGLNHLNTELAETLQKFEQMQNRMTVAGTETDLKLDRSHLELVERLEKSNRDLQKNSEEVAKATQTAFDEAFKPIEQGFSTMIRGMVSGRQTLQQSLLSAGSQWLEHELTNDATYLAKKLATYAADALGFDVAETQKQVAQDATNSSGLIGLIEKAIKAITTDSVETSAGVTAFLAPEIGPYAVPAGVAAGAVVASLASSVPSAAGGWIVNQTGMAMIHEDERVLPSKYSAGLDAMVESYAQGGGGGDTHYHDNSTYNLTVSGSNGAALIQNLRTAVGSLHKSQVQRVIQEIGNAGR